VIRSEAVEIGLVRGAPQLRNCFGFCFNPNVAGDTLAGSLVTTIRADIEYADGRMTWLALRSGQLVGSTGRLMTRVWLTNANGGVLGLDVAYDQDDRLVPNPAAPSEPTSYEESAVALPAGYVIDTGNGTEVAVFEKPAWKPKGAALWTHNGGIDPFRNWSGAIEHLIVQQFATGPRLLVSGWQALPDTTGSAAFGYEQGVALLAVYGSGTEPGNGNFQAGPTHPRVPSPPPARIVVRLRGSSAPRTVQPGKTANIWCQWWR
jgi:hypothetical protein